MKYKNYTPENYKHIDRIQALAKDQLRAIEVVGSVLPFKVNNYIINELIDWDDIENDPIFKIVFPQQEMLSRKHYRTMDALMRSQASTDEIRSAANRIRAELNPHPAGQMEHNVPELNGIRLKGIQHKYRETILFFPSQGQTCHAFCSFCFRWPQFIGNDTLRFGMNDPALLLEYLRAHPEISDVLITGGDPMTMSVKLLKRYILPIIEGKLPHVRVIRIGTKSLTYWPYRYLTDKDSRELLDFFKRINQSGTQLALMAHFNHPNEFATDTAHQAIARILETGTLIRTQSPLLRHINDDPEIWIEMWKKQVDLGMIPYYMFVARDTGARQYFAVPLVKAWQIFREAYSRVSGICRTVRGPSMSAWPGKIEIAGIPTIHNEKKLALRFIQGRNPDWVYRVFFADYDEKALWLDELTPSFNRRNFFFEETPEFIAAAKN